jgi:hypothetical protein
MSATSGVAAAQPHYPDRHRRSPAPRPVCALAHAAGPRLRARTLSSCISAYWEQSVIQDYWNTALSILPFALFLISAWAVLSSDRWLLPLSMGLGSFVVQCQVEFALPVALIGLILATVASRRAGPAHNWRRPFALAAAVVAVLWIPPVVDELTGHPGNLTVLLRYLRTTRGSWPWRDGGNAVLTQLGRLRAWLVGRAPVRVFATSRTLPVWPGLLTLAALAAITALAVWRRRSDLLWLVLVVGVAGGAAAVVVSTD